MKTPVYGVDSGVENREGRGLWWNEDEGSGHANDLPRFTGSLMTGTLGFFRPSATPWDARLGRLGVSV